MIKEIIKDLRSVKTIEDAQNKINQIAMNGSTIFKNVYTDFEGKEYYSVIKGYKLSDADYVIVATDIRDFKEKLIEKIEVIVMDKQPMPPHELFPILGPMKKIAKKSFVFS